MTTNDRPTTAGRQTVTCPRDPEKHYFVEFCLKWRAEGRLYCGTCTACLPDMQAPDEVTHNEPER